MKKFILKNKNTILIILVLATLIVNYIAIHYPILRNDDSVLYAIIAKNIVVNHDWINLTYNNKDWLDKPHLFFWIIAIFFKILAINPYSYNLPGFLCNIIAAIYTYLFYKKLSPIKTNIQHFLVIFLLYITTLHLFVSASIDIRAEAYLLATMIPACYYWYLTYFNYKYLYHIAAIIFTALGIMIKGVFLIVPVFSAIILEYLYHIFTIHIRQNKLSIKHIIKQEFWHISKKTIITILFILIILSPELISLYLQFDIHPDKIIYNSKNVSGIKWFFLDSQFGRFFGNGPIHKNNNLDHYVFFIHTFLWSFLPWTFIFIVALYKTIKAYKNHLNQQLQKYYNVSYRYLCFSFVPTFILFSLTSFQLDYYINILLPFALIFITLFIYRNNQIDKYFLQIVYGSILINVIFTLIIYLHGIIYARYDIGYNVAKYINNIHHNQELCNNNKLKNELNVIDYKVNSTTLNFYLKPNLYYNHKYLIANNILQLQKLYSNSDNMYLLVEHNNFNDILNIINNKQSNIIYLTKFSGMSIENTIKTFFNINKNKTNYLIFYDLIYVYKFNKIGNKNECDRFLHTNKFTSTNEHRTHDK